MKVDGDGKWELRGADARGTRFVTLTMLAWTRPRVGRRETQSGWRLPAFYGVKTWSFGGCTSCYQGMRGESCRQPEPILPIIGSERGWQRVVLGCGLAAPSRAVSVPQLWAITGTAPTMIRQFTKPNFMGICIAYKAGMRWQVTVI